MARLLAQRTSRITEPVSALAASSQGATREAPVGHFGHWTTTISRGTTLISLAHMRSQFWVFTSGRLAARVGLVQALQTEETLTVPSWGVARRSIRPLFKWSVASLSLLTV